MPYNERSVTMQHKAIQVGRDYAHKGYKWGSAQKFHVDEVVATTWANRKDIATDHAISIYALRAGDDRKPVYNVIGRFYQADGELSTSRYVCQPRHIVSSWADEVERKAEYAQVLEASRARAAAQQAAFNLRAKAINSDLVTVGCEAAALPIDRGVSHSVYITIDVLERLAHLAALAPLLGYVVEQDA
jgi:hypothetical protein